MGRDPRTKIVVFAPHPDDDVIACGGTIAQRVAAGNEVFIVYMTDGRHSHSAVLDIHTNPTPSELSSIRKGEATRAAALLGVPTKNLYFLGMEDTKLADVSARCVNRVIAILEELGQILEVFFPLLEDLHRDHSATHRIVADALGKVQALPALYGYQVWNESVEQEFGVRLRNEDAPQSSTRARGTRVDVVISPFLERKIRALKEHATQVGVHFSGQTRPIISTRLLAELMAQETETFWRVDITRWHAPV